jgi:hypothetical protein
MREPNQEGINCNLIITAKLATCPPRFPASFRLQARTFAGSDDLHCQIKDLARRVLNEIGRS